MRGFVSGSTAARTQAKSNRHRHMTFIDVCHRLDEDSVFSPQPP